MSRIYLYAIVPAAERPPFDVAGVWPADPQVRTIRGGGLAAVVGASPPVDFRALPREDAVRYLLAHQRVVEAVMRGSAALPVKFGTVLADEADVVSLLARGESVLSPPLVRLARHVQIELIVSWPLDQVLREVAAEDAVAQLKAQIAAQAATSDRRVELGRLVKASIDRRRSSCRTRIVAALQSVVADVAENALMDDRMVANLALLVPDGAIAAFDQCLAQLDEVFDGRLNFRCIGPLPPYSFATVEVILPSFDAIDQARRTLSLGDTAGRAEIKSAYRRLIKMSHSDLRISAPVDDGQAAKLTDAYKTLMSYVQALPSKAADDASPARGCRFDRGTVERSMLVAVRRQELARADASP